MTHWRPEQRVRVVAIGIACRRDELLVMWVEDDAGALKGARPPGGAVEFSAPPTRSPASFARSSRPASG